MIKRKASDMILETERLYLREMNQSDFNSLCKIMQDTETMYAYEGAFSDSEVPEWLDRALCPVNLFIICQPQPDFEFPHFFT